MTSILTVIGARPQFIKAAPVSRALSVSGVEEHIIHTGQHYDPQMSAIFFEDLAIPRPAVLLDVGSRSHGAQTAAMLVGVEQVIVDRRPDLVLVYGDTNSTLAGALAAVKQHVPVAHVEAGLRSFNRMMPEEINRIVTDHVAELLFAPTAHAVEMLADEGISSGVHQVGDVMLDATLMFMERATSPDDVRSRFGVSSKEFALVTIHRAESTDDERILRAIVEAVSLLAERIEIVVPLHPRTRHKLNGLSVQMSARVKVVEPVGYLDMLALERDAAVVLTDSGGVQKEAFFQMTPCVTVRSETEWTELVESGWNRLVAPLLPVAIVDAVLTAVGTTGTAIQPYGDGHAAERIATLVAGHRSSWFPQPIVGGQQ